MKANQKLCNKLQSFALIEYQGVTLDKSLFPHHNLFHKKNIAGNGINQSVRQ